MQVTQQEEGVDEEVDIAAAQAEEGDEVTIAEIEVEVEVVEVIANLGREVGWVTALTAGQIETLHQAVKVREVIYVIIATNQAILLGTVPTNH